VLAGYGLIRTIRDGRPAGKNGAAESASPEQTDEYPEISGGGVLMLGPIPVIFGSDKHGVDNAIKFAIMLVLLYIIVLLVF
jgi:uncharacterized protein (TIGR00304 family)